jgi:hypothetical protein
LRTLVFGLTGQLGDALRPRLAELGPGLVAVSRGGRPAEEAIDWRVGMLQAMPTLPGDIGTIVSLGPLDAFADWYARDAPPGVTRVLAIGSTGIHDKQDSPDSDERALAARLAGAEAQLFAAAAARGAAATVLRPTLLYGNGRDRSLTPLAALARAYAAAAASRRARPAPARARGRRRRRGASRRCQEPPRTGAPSTAGGETLPSTRWSAGSSGAGALDARPCRVPAALRAAPAPLASAWRVPGSAPGAGAHGARPGRRLRPARAAFGLCAAEIPSLTRTWRCRRNRRFHTPGHCLLA